MFNVSLNLWKKRVGRKKWVDEIIYCLTSQTAVKTALSVYIIPLFSSYLMVYIVIIWL